MASMGGMRGEDMRPSRGREEWQRLGLDPRQWAYGTWWSMPGEGEDPVPLDPQPTAPLFAKAHEN